MVKFTKGWENHESAPAEQMRKTIVAQADEIRLLKEQIQQEVKEKYQLYETMKQLGGTHGQEKNQKATEETSS
jgi:hypothetical protein